MVAAAEAATAIASGKQRCGGPYRQRAADFCDGKRKSRPRSPSLAMSRREVAARAASPLRRRYERENASTASLAYQGPTRRSSLISLRFDETEHGSVSGQQATRSAKELHSEKRESVIAESKQKVGAVDLLVLLRSTLWCQKGEEAPLTRRSAEGATSSLSRTAAH